MKIGTRVTIKQNFLSHADIASGKYEGIMDKTHTVIRAKGDLIKTDLFNRWVNVFYFNKEGK